MGTHEKSSKNCTPHMFLVELSYPLLDASQGIYMRYYIYTCGEYSRVFQQWSPT